MPSKDLKVLSPSTFSIWRLTCLLVVIINEADTLSRDAQAALRRTMEKYMSNMRIILCANSTSRLISPIKSRCLLMRVAAPNRVEVRVCSFCESTLFRKCRCKQSCNMFRSGLGSTYPQKPLTRLLMILREIFEKPSSSWKRWKCSRMRFPFDLMSHWLYF